MNSKYVDMTLYCSYDTLLYIYIYEYDDDVMSFHVRDEMFCGTSVYLPISLEIYDY